MRFIVPVLLVAVTFSLALALPHQRRQHHRRAVPQESNQRCSSTCTGVSNKFKYAIGKSHAYAYEAETNVQLPGSSDSTAVRQKAKVIISALSPCEFTMKMSDVALEGGESAENWNEELEQRPLRFAFDDGLISHICPHPEEKSWVLNIKRAVLSAFQNGLEGSRPSSEVYETDVSGSCPTKYSREEARGVLTISKTKNLVECQSHHGNYSALRGVNYHIKSELQNVPLMKSTQTCSHSIEGSMLKTAECSETHAFRPFSESSDAGILATTSTKLTFKASKSGSIESEIGERSGLEFDHSEYSFEESSKAKDAARENLRALCQTSSNDVRPETPGTFTELVYNMRRINKKDLKKLYQESIKMAICKREKNFFLDAIPMCASEGCLDVMVGILRTGALGKREQAAWLMSLSLVPRPTKDMVKAVTMLIDTMPNQALLGVSSLVHGYCKQNPLCAEVPEVEGFVRKLEEVIGAKCQVNGNEERVLLALKAIGNVGHIRSVIPRLTACINHEKNPLSVRISAIQALRRMPCNDDLRSPLMARLMDVEENVEVRLTAFLGIMKCPTPEILENLVNFLDNEPINQVTSFVYSYLKAKRASTDPVNAELSRLLRRHVLHRRFARDPIQYSNFYEVGQFMESLNAGAHLEEANIFVPESSMPRQTFSNLTVHLFGTSINLLEVGGRFEGLDHLVNGLFGPQGYLVNPGKYLLGESPKDSKNSRVRTFQDLWTEQRPANNHVNLNVYMKIFGDELATYNYADAKIVESMKKLMDFGRLMSAMENFKEYELNKNILFLDSVLTVPTASGMPLRLAVNGTTSLNLGLKSIVDVKKLMQPPHNFQLMGHIIPSAAIEISAMMAVETAGYKSGVRMVTRVHTSTDLKSTISMKEGKTFQVKTELPKQKMEIIDIQSQVFTVRNNREVEQSGNADEQTRSKCSPAALNKISGLKVCSEMRFPRRMRNVAYAPLSSPLRARITVEKDDATLQSYEFTTSVQTSPNMMAKMSLDTPGSAVDRLVKLEMEIGDDMKAELRYPGKEIALQGSMVRSSAESTGSLALTVDKKDQYAMSTTVKYLPNNKMEIDGEVTRPGAQPVKLTGSMEYPGQGSSKYGAVYKVENLYSKPVEVKGIFGVEGAGQNMKYESEFMLKCPAIDIDASYKTDLKNFGMDSSNQNAVFRLTHKRPEDASAHVLKTESKAKFEKTPAGNKGEMSGSWESNWYSQFDHSFGYTFLFEPKQIENKMNLKWGNRKHSAELVQVTRVTENDKYTTEVTVQSKPFRLDHKAVAIYQNRFPEMFVSSVTIDTPKMKDIKADIKLTNDNSGKLKMKADASLEFPGRKLEFTHSLEEQGKNEYKSSGVIDLGKGKKLEIDSDLKLRSKGGKYDYEIESEATVNGDSANKIKLMKRFKMGPKESRTMGYLKYGDKKIYDIKLDMVEESKTKSVMHSHIKSDALANGVDYQVNGEIESLASTSKGHLILRKNQKDYLKGELVVPKKMGRNDEKELRATVQWDMDAGKAKELSAEYTFEVEGKKKTHQLTSKVDMGAKNNYEMKWRVHKSDHYAVNTTATHNGQQIMDFSVGIVKVGSYEHPSEFAFDIELMSKAPLPALHHSALITHKCDDKSFKTTGYVQCHTSNNKLSIDADYQRVNPKEVNYELKLQANERFLKLKEEMSFGDSYDPMSVKTLKAKLEVAAEPNKKMTYTTDLQTGWPFKLTQKFQSPYKTLSEVDSLIEMKGQGKNQEYKFETSWNKNKEVNFRLNGGRQGRSGEFDTVIETSFKSMKKIETKLSYNMQRNWEMDAAIKWANNQKLRAFHKSTDKKLSTGFESKVGANDVEGKVEAEMNNQGLYKADILYKHNEKSYELDADINTKQMKGSVEVKTPNKSYKSTKLTISQGAESEWKIETDQNGEAQIVITSIAKMDAGDHRLKFQVTKINFPFGIEYEGKYSDDRWRMKVEAIKAPESADKKVYGLHLSDELKNENERDIDLRIKTPARQSMLKVNRLYDLPKTCSFKAEFTPNMAESREPTKLELTYTKRSESLCVAELHLSDPSLPKGIKAIGKVNRDGSCETEMDACNVVGELRIDYSGKKDNILVVKSKFNSEKIEEQRSIRGRQVSTRGVSKRTEFEINHPATNLHGKWWAKRTMEKCGKHICRVEMESGMEYKDAQKQVKQMSVSGEYNTFLPKMSLKLNTPERRWAVSGQRGAQRGEYQLIVSKDAEPMYMTVVRASSKDKTLVFEVRSMKDTEEVLFHSSARLVNKHLAEVKIWHTENGKRLDDGLISIKLDKSDLLNTRFYLRPGLDQELKAASSSVKDAVSRVDGSDLNNYWASQRDAHRAFHNDVYAHTRPLFEQWGRHKESLSADLGPVVSEVLEIAELYIDITKELVLAAMDIVESSIDNIMETVPSQSITDGYFAMKDAMKNLPRTMATLMRPMKNAARALTRLVAQTMQQIGQVKDAAYEKLSVKQIKAALDDIYREAEQYPIIKKILDLLFALKDKVEKADFKGVKKTVKSYYNKAEDKVNEATESVSDFWVQWEDSVMDYELGRALVEFFKESWESLRFTYQYVSPEDRIDDAFRWFRNQFHAYRENQLGYDQYLPKIIENKPEEGIFEIQVPLPVKLQSLEHSALAFHPDTYQTIRTRVSERMTAVSDSISDYIGSIPAAPNSAAAEDKLQDVLHTLQGYSQTKFETEWPSKSSALLVGDQHFVTFDGKVFAFKANCEYLLARDFATKEFTISAKFGRSGSNVALKHVKLETQGHEVELHRGGQVKIDGQVSELPWQKMDELDGKVHLQVVRWDHSATVKTQDGVKVSCDWYYHKCKITLPGHYHGKSAGLLGSNDNEVFNDLTLPNGERAEDIDEFAKGWHVGGGNCDGESNAAQIERHADHEDCIEYFQNKRASPFSACFRHVNPRPFLTMCEQGMKIAESDHVVCNISAAYTAMCRIAGISLQMPNKCIRCETPIRSLVDEEDVEIDENQAPKAADVVFVVEETECTEWSKAKTPELARLIKGAMSKKGIQDVRYGVVGFGGEGVHSEPHFHSGDSSINFDLNGLKKAADSLDFELNGLMSPRPVDPMVPLKFVADYYPFRPAVRKVVVLITCTECKARKVGYYELQGLLLNNGIQLHMITDTQVELRSDSEGVLGLDATSLFGGSGDAERKDLLNPHDSCTILAQETRGAVFSSSNAGKAVKSLAKVIGDKTESAAVCQICECTTSCECAGTPLTRCFPCDIPRPVSLEGGRSFLNIPYLKLKPAGF